MRCFNPASRQADEALLKHNFLDKRREVQLLLDILLLVVLEIHDLLTRISFGPSVPVPGLAYLLAPPFGSECLTSLADAMTYYALC